MMRESIERAIDTKNLFFLTDVTANAKGYEIMARAKLTMSGESRVDVPKRMKQKKKPLARRYEPHLFLI